MKKIVLGLLAAAFLFSPLAAQAAVYEIDTAHSSVGFKIKHLLSNTRGTFNDFSGMVEYEPGKPESWKADAVIKTASVNTNNADRDKHLRNEDFFDVERYPEMTFKTTKISQSSESTAKLEGVLSLHGVEKPVVLDLEILGAAKDPWGSNRAAFTATGKINRKDFGIVYNKVLDNGGVMLGEEVDITIEIEAIEKK